MGYIRHTAIVVTAWDVDTAESARAEAERLGMHPTPVVGSHINGYGSFLCPPDGSKSGWDEDAAGNERRESFIGWMESPDRESERMYLSWVEVDYGGDDEELAYIVRHSGAPAVVTQRL